MFGCLRRLGCLFVLCIAAVAAAFLTRDRWMPLLSGADSSAPETVEATAGPAWQPVSDEGAARARRTIESLGRRTGPVFANLTAGGLATFFYISPCPDPPPPA